MIFTFCVIALIISGCNEPQTPSEKQSRLIAAENMKLKNQIEELNLQIEQIRDQHQKEIEARDKSLADAHKEIETLKEKSKQNVRNQVQNVLDTVIKENTELREEIKKLNEQLQTQ